MKAAVVLCGLGLLAVFVWFGAEKDRRNDHLSISEVVAAPMREGSAAAFMKIENLGAPDRLIGVESPVADAALHSPGSTDSPPIPVGKSSLAPDSAHIMLTGASEMFADGALIPITLTFAEAGPVKARVRVIDPKPIGGVEHTGHAGLVDTLVVGDGEPTPQIAISAAPEGEGWRVKVETEGFTFSKDLVDLNHVPGVGHGHLYVGGIKIGRLYEAEAYIGALPKGQHEIRVTLNTNDHRAYVVDDELVTASTLIDVD